MKKTVLMLLLLIEKILKFHLVLDLSLQGRVKDIDNKNRILIL